MKNITNFLYKRFQLAFVFFIILLFSGAALSHNIKNTMTSLYSKCIHENGGISNGSISHCTTLVNNKIDEEIEIIISKAISKSQSRVDKNNENLVKYDQELTERLHNSIYEILLHTANLCTYFSYNIGGPAEPICNMSFRLKLLDELITLEQD